MMDIRYAPGEAWAVAAGGRCVVVAGDAAPALIAELHAALAAGADLARIVDAFTGAFGASLHSLPPFAAVFPERDGVRVAVRGALAVSVDAAGAGHEFTGAGVTTWSERVIEGAAGVRVRVQDAAAPAAYPLADGAALVSAVVLGRTDVAASAASASPSRQVRDDAVPTPPVPTPPVPTPTAPAQPEPEPASRAQGAWSRLAAAIPAPDLDPSAPPEASLDTLLPRETTVSPADASPVPAATTTGYDELWGATVLRSVEDAAVRPDEDEAAEAPAAPAPADRPGDHDGQTVSVAQLRALRGDSAPTIDSIPPLAPARPSAPGRLRVSNGQSVLLDRTVIVGRRPRSTRVAGTDLPHLVAVDSPQQDISRSHVEFRVEGDSILVTDLHTTNGTMLVRPGAAPARLHPGEATVAVAGDVIDLGDGITVAVEALS